MKVKDNRKKMSSRYAIALLTTFLLISYISYSVVPFTNAQTPEDLAATYSPVLHFTKNEKFHPTTVDYFISRASLIDHSIGIVVDPSPTPESLGQYNSSNLYLNHNLENLEAITSDYSSEAERNGYHIYAHVVDTGSRTIIQYWLFYVFNNGPLNDHQGDFEVIEVFLDYDGPQKALYSQHHAGQNAAWSEVEKIDSHPVAYVAEGSHANYFRSYQGRMGIENDIVGNDGITITFNQSNIIMLQNQSWLNFAGRWGYWGTDTEVALGRAGPHGPVFNQDGLRWERPFTYLNQTFPVDWTYFTLAWLVANFLLLFLIYILARGGWKLFKIYRMTQKGSVLTKFLRSRGGPFLIIGIISMVLAFVALFLPWYSIAASSEVGPLAQEDPVNLMTVDGVNGLSINLFLGNGEATSGFRNVFSTKLPLAIIFVASLVLLALDIIATRNGKRLGKKFIIGGIALLIPSILILVLISQLPSLLPWASSLLPGQEIPPQLEIMVNSIATNPLGGTVSQSFEVVGVTTVNWGLGTGAYLFLVTAILRIIGGLLMLGTGEAQPELAG